MAASRRSAKRRSPIRKRLAAPPGTRIEKDLLGERAVPADALYGIHTVRAVENLGFSGRTLANYPDYIRALATVKKAAARANRDAHVIDARRQDAIERACDALIRGEHLAQFPIDMLAGGGGIAVNMNVNEVIANLANEHLGGARGTYLPVHPKRHVNASQSTADVCHTAVRMTVLNRWSGLRRALRQMRRGISRQGGGAAAGHHDLAHLPAGRVAGVARRTVRRSRRSDRASRRAKLSEACGHSRG